MTIFQEIPAALLSEYLSSQDQKLTIPLNPTAADNPYDSVLRYNLNLGAATHGQQALFTRPPLLQHLQGTLHACSQTIFLQFSGIDKQPLIFCL